MECLISFLLLFFLVGPKSNRIITFVSLVHKFNRHMYRTFVSVAVEDCEAGKDRTGMDFLFRFCADSLALVLRDRLFKDFVGLVAAEASDNTPGVEV